MFFQLAEVLPSVPTRTWELAKQLGVTYAVSRVPEDAEGVEEFIDGGIAQFGIGGVGHFAAGYDLVTKGAFGAEGELVAGGFAVDEEAGSVRVEIVMGGGVVRTGAVAFFTYYE